MCRKPSKVVKETADLSLGLDFDQRWQIIQHFTDWIKHGDSKIQMLLTVQGVIVAAYATFAPKILSDMAERGGWEWYTWVAVVVCSLLLLGSFIIGFLALQPYTKSYNSAGGNLFFYGTYKMGKKNQCMESVSEKVCLEYLSEQIAVLGKVAWNKFFAVVILQWVVFSNVLILLIIVILSSFWK
ncbi:Pycsar system effector family protein [Rothia sp. HMSC069D01]|jgi:hypothetical protein|uniref:Pycsar system effector family protein n=1 Tax=Rothia sp. HMSC069D01 TaxID=1715189 RepID=UPI0008A5C4E3|nr:Pycsar system effector family protein [Rothia sp. HMSC069D01]OFM23926.1 hypothetical protein HMPREF2710_08050 [Rothia sp. HMSC069D01]